VVENKSHGQYVAGILRHVISCLQDWRSKNLLAQAAQREAEEDWGWLMDAREAFCIAVKFYRSGDWNPALPAFNKVEVRGQPLTLRQVCGFVEHITDPLPNSVVSDLLTSMRARRRNIEEDTTLYRTYAGGARCLLRLMDERECAVQQKLERDAA